MEDLLERVLIDGIRGGILSGNRLASVLLNMVQKGRIYTTSRRELAADLVSSPMPKGAIYESEQMKTDKSNSFSDLRFLGMSLAGIKKYPVKKLNFGLSFANQKGKPVNSIFVGENGVGKTSIYSALEYVGMGKINSAQLRGYERKIGEDVANIPTESQSDFLFHSGTETKDMSLCLFTKDKEIILEGNNLRQSGKPEITEAFYCSDFDVRELETNMDYTRFMLRQIGLDHFYQALQLLYYLGVFVRTEQIKPEDNIWEDRNEPIERLKLGIALGYLKRKITFNKTEIDWEYLKNVIEQNEDNILVKNTSESAISLLSKEQAQFPQKEWFSIGVYKQYESLLTLLRNFQNGNNTFGVLKDGIDSFLKFRKQLILGIEMLKKRSAESKKPETKLRLINEVAQRHIYAHNHLIENNEQNHVEGLFESEEKAKLFEDEYKVLVDCFEKYLVETLTEWRRKISASIKMLLSDYFTIDNDKLEVELKINSTKEGFEIIKSLTTDEMEFKDIIYPFISFNIHIMTAQGELNSDERIQIKLRQYLNTFKFKLVCVAIKIALGCFVKETYDINYPFVIDDVFDSSDFENRLQLKQFVKNIVKCHDKLLKGNKYAIQFLFFTQDDLIANQIKEGLTANKEDSNVKFGRIYDYHDVGESDIKELNVDYSDSKLEIRESQSGKREEKKYRYISLEG